VDVAGGGGDDFTARLRTTSNRGAFRRGAAAAVVALGGLGAEASAHPGHGIVVDAAGHIHFVDLAQESVWTLAPDGSLRQRVIDRHLHRLAVDDAGNLYVDHQEYAGPPTPDEPAGTRMVSVWRLAPDGALTEVLAPRAAPTRIDGRAVIDDLAGGPGVLRDADGASWGIERVAGSDHSRLVRAAADGTVTVVSPRIVERMADGERAPDLGPLQAKAWGRDGSVLLTEGGTVWRLTRDGAIRAIGGDPLARDPVSGLGIVWQDSVLGVAEHADGTVYAADYGRRCVRRIAPDDVVTTCHRAPWGWSPTGVTVDGDDVLVLEHRVGISGPILRLVGVRGGLGGPRVVRIDANGAVTVLATVNGGRPRVVLVVVIGLVLGVVLLVRHRIRSRRTAFPLEPDAG
jgi:hypothetical protein